MVEPKKQFPAGHNPEWERNVRELVRPDEKPKTGIVWNLHVGSK